MILTDVLVNKKEDDLIVKDLCECSKTYSNFLCALLYMSKMLKRREEWNTYLSHVCRHHCGGESPVKRLNIRRFQPTHWLSSAVDVAYVYS